MSDRDDLAALIDKIRDEYEYDSTPDRYAIPDAILAAYDVTAKDTACSFDQHVFPVGRGRDSAVVCRCEKIVAYADGTYWANVSGRLIPWTPR